MDRISGSVSGIWPFFSSSVSGRISDIKNRLLDRYPANLILSNTIFSYLKNWDASILCVTLSNTGQEATLSFTQLKYPVSGYPAKLLSGPSSLVNIFTISKGQVISGNVEISVEQVLNKYFLELRLFWNSLCPSVSPWLIHSPMNHGTYCILKYNGMNTRLIRQIEEKKDGYVIYL